MNGFTERRPVEGVRIETEMHLLIRTPGRGLQPVITLLCVPGSFAFPSPNVVFFGCQARCVGVGMFLP